MTPSFQFYRSKSWQHPLLPPAQRRKAFGYLSCYNVHRLQFVRTSILRCFHPSNEQKRRSTQNGVTIRKGEPKGIAPNTVSNKSPTIASDKVTGSSPFSRRWLRRGENAGKSKTNMDYRSLCAFQSSPEFTTDPSVAAYFSLAVVTVEMWSCVLSSGRFKRKLYHS